MTLDQPKKRAFSLTDRCLLCGMDEENIEHILIHCFVVWGLRTSILAAMSIGRVPS